MNIQFIYNVYNRRDDTQYNGIILVDSEYVKHLHLYHSNYNEMIGAVREAVCKYTGQPMNDVGQYTVHDMLIDYDSGWRGI